MSPGPGPVCFDSVAQTHDPSQFPGVIKIIHCSVSNMPIAVAIFVEVSLWIQQLQNVQNVGLATSVEILVILAILFLAGSVEPVAYGEFCSPRVGSESDMCVFLDERR